MTEGLAGSGMKDGKSPLLGMDVPSPEQPSLYLGCCSRQVYIRFRSVSTESGL